MSREDMIDMAVRRVAIIWVGPHTEDIEEHYFNPSAGGSLRADIRAEFQRIVALRNFVREASRALSV